MKKRAELSLDPGKVKAKSRAPLENAEKSNGSKCWSELGLPKEAITLPRSLPDPVDSGFGESYTTVQMHYGKFLLKALSKRKKNDPNLLLSPVHLSLLKSFEVQFSKPHLAPLRAALVAIHLRSAGEKHHLILQCKRVTSAVISSAKKFSSWSLGDGTIVAFIFSSRFSNLALA